jgi:hypothetical protein
MVATAREQSKKSLFHEGNYHSQILDNNEILNSQIKAL